MMYLINYSIIIPHFDIPELLLRCLKSIPIREDIQVIVVDDCSPGANTYFEKYPEFNRPYLEWYSTPKGGSAGRARNIGLDYAKGKWVICIDADDLFVDDMEEILEESINRDEDILFYNYHSVYSDDLSKKASRDYYQSFFKQYTINHDETPFRYYFEVIWCKIIRRNLIEEHHIRCDETKYGNDFGFSLKIGYYANKIAILDRPLFIITQRDNSLASSYFNGKKFSRDECMERIWGVIKNQDFCDTHEIKLVLPSFDTLKTKLLSDFPFTYFLVTLRSSIQYPQSFKRLFWYWYSWKKKALNHIIKKIHLT